MELDKAMVRYYIDLNRNPRVCIPFHLPRDHVEYVSHINGRPVTGWALLRDRRTGEWHRCKDYWTDYLRQLKGRAGPEWYYAWAEGRADGPDRDDPRWKPAGKTDGGWTVWIFDGKWE